MCGIAGIVSRRTVTNDEIALVGRSLKALHHRGPDSVGTHVGSHAVIGNTRLSIIDVAGGTQPFYSEDRNAVLVANGEIYNFPELRRRLQDRGHRLRSGSDCEVIVHLYESEGVRCVDHLRGMFAFAIWDDRARKLIVVRDRMGEKPLYYYEDGDRLVFASELAAITSSVAGRWRLDAAAVHDYLAHQYIEEPRTAVDGIRKLPAGAMLTVSVDPWVVAETTYWTIDGAPPLAVDPASAIRSQLETACRLTLQSDVPVGVALSGGVDSQIVAALCSRAAAGRPLHAFTVGYTGRTSTDERDAARAAADRFGMEWHQTELAPDDVASDFASMVVRRGDPIADITGSAYDALFRMASEAGVRVLLTGQGGDELFWGYRWVRHALDESLLRQTRVAGGTPSMLPLLRNALPAALTPVEVLRFAAHGFGVANMWRAARRIASNAPPPAFYEVQPTHHGSMVELYRVYPKQFLQQLPDQRSIRYGDYGARQDILMTRRICETYLRENGLAQSDRLSMAHSIEVRSPFVDHKLVETVMGLRKSFPDHKLAPKQLLLSAFPDLLPANAGSKKRGFTPPIRAWHEAIFAKHGRKLAGGFLVDHGVLTAASAAHLSKGAFPRARGVPLSMKALVLELWLRGVLG